MGGGFTLIERASIYGGFASGFAERNPATNETILDKPNAGNIITVPNGATQATALDGLTIRSDIPSGSGSTSAAVGVYLSGTSCGLTIRNCAIIVKDERPAENPYHEAIGIQTSGTGEYPLSVTDSRIFVRKNGSSGADALNARAFGIYIGYQTGANAIPITIARNEITVSFKKGNNSYSSSCVSLNATTDTANIDIFANRLSCHMENAMGAGSPYAIDINESAVNSSTIRVYHNTMAVSFQDWDHHQGTAVYISDTNNSTIYVMNNLIRTRGYGIYKAGGTAWTAALTASNVKGNSELCMYANYGIDAGSYTANNNPTVVVGVSATSDKLVWQQYFISPVDITYDGDASDYRITSSSESNARIIGKAFPITGNPVGTDITGKVIPATGANVGAYQ